MYINIITVLCAIICYAYAIALHNIDLMALSILIAEIVKVLIMQRALYKEYSLKLGRLTWMEIGNTIGFVICYYYYGVYSAIVWYMLSISLLAILFKKEAFYIIEFIKK